METKHTQGIWTVDSSEADLTIWANGMECIATVWNTTAGELEGNAKIMAASPLLLEALEEVKKEILVMEQEEFTPEEVKGRLNTLFHTCREAILKATT